MILPRKEAVPKETTGGLDTVAVRLPSHPVARRSLAAAGGYVAAPSANTSGKPSPVSDTHLDVYKRQGYDDRRNPSQQP